MSTPDGTQAESPESGDADTTSLYGNPAGEPDPTEQQQDDERDLMSADQDPLPDEQV